MKNVVIFLVVLLGAGCASHMAVLKNQETGDVKTCETGSAAAYTIYDMANRSKFNKCIAALEKAGYKQVK